MDLIIELREEIDSLDDKLMELLNERFEKSIAIGDRKTKSLINVLDTNRESFIIEKSLKHNHASEIATVYRAIMAESKKLQRK